MKQITIIVFLSFLFSSTINTQSTYSKVFDISEDAGEAGFQVLLHNNQYYILVGLRDIFTFEGYPGILILDVAGQVVLSNSFYEEVGSINSAGPEGMIIANNKVYIAATYLNPENNFDFALLHLGIEDNQTWKATYGSPLDESATSLKTGEDGTLILLGDQKHESGANSYDAVLLKTDLDGIELSRQIIDIDVTILTRELQELSDSTLLIGGITCLPNSPSCFSQKSAVILKMRRSGEILWTHLMPETGSPSESFQVIELDDGRLAASWYRDTFPPGGVTYEYPCTIYFLDSLGNQEYYVPFDAPYDKQIINLRLLSNGDILGIGTTNGFPDYNTEGGWLFRMTQQGELLWEQKIMDYRFESGFGWFNDGMETPDGGIIAVGFIENAPAQSVDVWVIQLTADGCFLDSYDDCSDDLLMITAVNSNIPTPVGISVFPNPTHGRVKLLLDIDDGQRVAVNIFDIFGKTILFTTTNTKEIDIDLSNFSSGTYFVVARTKQQAFSAKIVKVK